MESIINYVKFKPKVICEVGVFAPVCIHSLPLMDEDTKMILIEPNPLCFQALKNTFSSDKRFVLYQNAIADKRGQIKLYNRPERKGQDASGFIEGLSTCPAIANDGYIPDESHTQIVDAVLFSDIDCGDIDVLCVDTEGAEWFVIKNLISRPKVITLETHYNHYNNPYIKEILDWMNNNKYKIIGKDSSDTIFERNE